jgi:hypothetical protein
MMLLMTIGAVNTNATKIYANLSADINTSEANAWWTAATKTFAWKTPWGNQATLTGLPVGDLSEYTLHVSVASIDAGDVDHFRILIYYGSGTTSHTFKPKAGENTFDLSTLDESIRKNVTEIKLSGSNEGSPSAETPYSAVINSVYLQKPAVLAFSETGKAAISLSDVVAAGDVAFDDQTGTATSTGTGTLTVTFAQPADLSALQSMIMTRTGDDICSTMQMVKAEGGIVNTWYGSKYQLLYDGFKNVAQNATDVKKIVWNVSAAGTMTISGIELQSDVITASDPALTPLTSAMYHVWTDATATATPTSASPYIENNIGNAMGQGSTIYGNGSVNYLQYTDLTGYTKMIVNGTPGRTIRILLNRVSDGGALTELNPAIGSNGKAEVDLTAYEFAHLNAIKLPWDGNTTTITGIDLYKAAEAPYKYSLSGSGIITASAEAALADVTATAIDATKLTKATALTTANPNCMIVANEGMVVRENNVIVNGVCDHLVLTDGYSFAAPIAFTATEAVYETTVDAAVGYATLCLPYAAAVPTGAKAYTITTDGTAISASDPLAAIAAGMPVLLKNSGTYAFQAANAAVTPDAAGKSGALTGTYTTDNVAAGNYVLQLIDGTAAFYRVAAGSEPAIRPFRAYLTAASGAKVITFGFGEATSIDGLQPTATAAGTCYHNLAGQRVVAPVKGLYIANGKKVIIK